MQKQNILADAIRKLRVATGQSQTSLATHMGVAHSTVHRWEIGERRPMPSHLREFVRMSPSNLRAVFENELGMTLGQLAMEPTGDLLRGVSEKKGTKDGDLTLDELVDIARERSRMLFLRAKNRDRKAASQLKEIALTLIRWTSD